MKRNYLGEVGTIIVAGLALLSAISPNSTSPKKAVLSKNYIVKRENSGSVTVVDNGWPSRREWFDANGNGDLTAYTSRSATMRGPVYAVIKKGDRRFEQAEEEYRENIYPNIRG